MAKRFNEGEIKLDVNAGRDAVAGIPKAETPFCVAVIGDFSGRANRGVCEPETIPNRPAALIDRDNFDEVLAKFRPEIRLPIGGRGMAFRFTELEDFHPDRLLQRAEPFRTLREARARVQNPATFAATAERGLGSRVPLPDEPDASEQQLHATAADVSRLTSGSLLDDMIDETEARASEPHTAPKRDELQEFVRRITQPEVVATADPRQGEVLALVDRVLSAQMRALLHVPDFQALESAWRALFLLVRRIETGPPLKLYLIDISKQELARDLWSSQDLRSTGLFRLLIEQSVGMPGAEPWALIAGNYTFGPGREQAELLARVAKIARAGGAPFIAAASPRLLGCESLATTPSPRDWRRSASPEDAEAWAALRGLPEAGSIGLVLPRFLLRLPYGKKTDPAESFDFEEMPGAPAHEDYLWGNPALACVLLLAQSFSDSGWGMRSGMHAEIDRLPLHVYEQDGESELKPCAETLLTEHAAERMIENGLMPLVSLKGSDTVRLVRLQSISDPLSPLAGRWTT